MKAKGIPDKIYLQVCGSCEQKYCDACEFEDLEDGITWSKDKIFPNDVEYIRADAFVEQLRKWIASHNENDYYTFGYISKHFDEIISNFKRYMEE